MSFFFFFQYKNEWKDTKIDNIRLDKNLNNQSI